MSRVLEDSASTAGVKWLATGGFTAVGSGGVGTVAQRTVQNPHVVDGVVSLANVGVVVGIIIALLGFVAQCVSLYRRDRREERITQAQLAALGHDTPTASTNWLSVVFGSSPLAKWAAIFAGIALSAYTLWKVLQPGIVDGAHGPIVSAIVGFLTAVLGV